MPVTNSAMAKTKAVPITARRNWRLRNWTLRSVTFHMSACLCRGGSDEPDSIAVETREPHVAVGPGGDPEGCLHPSGSAVVGGDLTNGRDTADVVVAGREPQAPVRTGGDGTGLLDPSRCSVEGIDPTVRKIGRASCRERAEHTAVLR